MDDNLRKWLPWILVAAVAVVIVIVIAVNSGGDDEAAATTTTAAPAGGEALKLASLLPLTGDLSPFGPGMEQAVQLAVDEANEAGGVHGEPVVRDGFDTATNPDAAGAEADKIIAGGYQAEVKCSGDQTVGRDGDGFLAKTGRLHTALGRPRYQRRRGRRFEFEPPLPGCLPTLKLARTSPN